MKNYIVVLTIGERIPIDGDELERVVQAKLFGSLFFSRRGMIDGKYFGSIVVDNHRAKGVKYSYDVEKDREPYSNEKEMPDIFSEHRDRMKELISAKNSGVIAIPSNDAKRLTGN